MKSVNEAAEEPLVRLAGDDWGQLTPENMRAVATWATLFTMTYEYADRLTLAANDEERLFLMNNLSPPPNWRVNIGRYDHGIWSHQCNHKGLYYGLRRNEGGMPEMNTQVTVFCFGHLIINTISTRAPNLSKLVVEYGASVRLQTIWPIGDEPVLRPDRPHTDDELELVAHSLLWDIVG